MTATHQLELQNITLAYPGKVLLDGVSMRFESGQLTSLQGRNGTGKSSLLRCMAGLSTPQAGQVLIDTTPILHLSLLDRSRLIGTLWTDRLRMPGFTLRDLVHMGTYNAQRLVNSTLLDKRTDECINALGIVHLANHSLDQLSDGELQKAMIARALAQEPCFLLLDEPTTFLDYVAKEELMHTLKSLCTNQGIGIVFTSHDIDIMDRYAQRRLELSQGKIHELPGVSRK